MGYFRTSGKVTEILRDINKFYGDELLLKIVKLYNGGADVRYLADRFGFDPDEIFLLLFHCAREGMEIRKYAKIIGG